MIFIGLFLFIALIIIALNLHNQSNLNEIKQYLQNNNCQDIVYSKGSYKALCDDYFTEIENSFTIDINKNSRSINYKDIKDLRVDKLNIVINSDFKIEFKEKDGKIYFLLGNTYTYVGTPKELNKIKVMMNKAGYDTWEHTDPEQIKYLKRLAKNV